MRIPVSPRPVIWAIVSTPVWCNAALLADDWAPRLASQMATSTSATVISSPTHSIHEVVL